MAAAYSAGDAKLRDLRYKNEADVFNLALYSAYSHESGLYLEGGLGYGHSWNDYLVDSIAIPGGVKKGDFGSDLFSAHLELGFAARLPRDFILVPSLGLSYTHLHNDSWTETIDSNQLVANRFGSGSDDGLDVPLGVRFSRLLRFGDDSYLAPEIRAAYIYSAAKTRPTITSSLAGMPGGMEMRGIDPGRSHWRVGAGLSGRINNRVDIRCEYDFDSRSGYKGHNLNASLGVEF
ncbi:MAG: autotransporter outer membrane beta-barrel domain-containing protein [Planctomycetes bacterium]|nr:autotransporter outer membrane beta-barrel domain-containing protein [Planctomycetota bacterium]